MDKHGIGDAAPFEHKPRAGEIGRALFRVACLQVEVQAFELAHDRLGKAAERPLLEFVGDSAHQESGRMELIPAVTNTVAAMPNRRNASGPILHRLPTGHDRDHSGDALWDHTNSHRAYRRYRLRSEEPRYPDTLPPNELQ